MTVKTVRSYRNCLSPLCVMATVFAIGPLVFADMREFSVGAGATENVDAAVVAPDGVVFSNAFVRPPCVTIEDVFPQRTAKQLLANADLGEWRVKCGHLNGWIVDEDVLPYNVVRGDGTMDVQLQARSANLLKCLKIRLVQNGGDIDVVYVYSRLLDSAKTMAKPGVNFDAIPLSGDGELLYSAIDCDLANGLANPPTTANDKALRLTSLTLERVGASGRFNLTAPLTTPATLTVADNVVLAMSGDGAINGGSITNDLALGGTVALADLNTPATFSGMIANSASVDLSCGEWTASLSKVKPTALIENASLRHFTGFRDINVSGSQTGAVFFVENDGQTATMQFHGFWAGQYTACCYITLEQQGNDVLATMTDAEYLMDNMATTATSTGFGHDFRKLTPTGKWTYCVTGATMVMDCPPTLTDVPSGATGGELTFAGGVESEVAVPLPARLKDGTYKSRTLENVYLCMLKEFRGIDTAGSTTAQVFFVESDGVRTTMQVHGFFANNYTACCYVEMQQSGSNVIVRQTGADYYSEKLSKVSLSQAWGRDFRTLEPKTSWAFDVKFMTTVFDVPRKVQFGELLSGHPITFPGMNLADLRGIADFRMWGPNSSGAYFFRNDGEEATVQLQGRFQNYAACCYVRFRQVGANVVMELVRSCYIYDVNAPGQVSYFGQDFDLILDQTTKWAYAPQSGTLLLSGAQREYVLNGSNTLVGGKVTVQSNAFVCVTAATALPANSTIEIAPGGRLYLDANKSAVSNQTFIIRRGGTLYQGHYDNVFDPRRSYVLIDGGDFVMSDQYRLKTDCSACYLNYYTFIGGGRVTGEFKPLLLGYNDGYITVTGTEPVSWECGGILVGRNNNPLNGSWTLYVDVDDVTQDESGDFVTSGGSFREWSESAAVDVESPVSRAVIRKRGAGTWRMDQANPIMVSDVVVEDGMLLLNGDNLIPKAGTNSCGVTLSGGRLKLAAGTTNTLSALSLANTSTIELEEGAVLEIGDSSEMTWAENAVLEFVGAVGRGAVRFGTSRSALSRAQRLSLRCGEKKMMLDNDGYLVDGSSLAIILR